MFWPNFLLLLFLVVACWCLSLVGACCCLLVPVVACCWCLLVVVVCVCVVGEFKISGLSPGPPSAGPPFPWTAQNFALFFLSHHNFHSFFSLWRVFSLNFGGAFWNSWAVVSEPQWPGGAAGVSHDSPRAHTPGLQKHHQNSTREPPEREEKNEFPVGEGKKKTRNFGPPTLRKRPTLANPILAILI